MKSNIYISRKILNTLDIANWAKDQGFVTMMPEDSLHVTVVFCKKVVDWTKVTRDEPEMLFIDVDEGKRSVHNFDGGACVLEFTSDDLIARNAELKNKGISGNHPTYRSHITISYTKPEGLDISDIEPYAGYIVLGPEIIDPINDEWKDSLEEVSLKELVTESHIENMNVDRLFDVFSTSYAENTGKSWDKEKFIKRSANWTFYGDEDGFVAFREQKGGLRKLVGLAGETTGVARGLKQLMDEGKPVWGAVSDKLARASKRYGFIAPHSYPGGALMIKMIFKSIPSSVFGGVAPKVDSDGGITLDYDDIGSTKKYFIANKQYFSYLTKLPTIREHLTGMLKVFFEKVLGVEL